MGGFKMKPVMSMTIAELVRLGYDVGVCAYDLGGVDEASAAVIKPNGCGDIEVIKHKDTFSMTYFSVKPKDWYPFNAVSVTAFTKSGAAK